MSGQIASKESMPVNDHFLLKIQQTIEGKLTDDHAFDALHLVLENGRNKQKKENEVTCLCSFVRAVPCEEKWLELKTRYIREQRRKKEGTGDRLERLLCTNTRAFH